jgi:hypothetical protein
VGAVGSTGTVADVAVELLAPVVEEDRRAAVDRLASDVGSSGFVPTYRLDGELEVAELV